MKAMNQVGIALVGGTLLTLTLVTTATAAQLQASGTISGTVARPIQDGATEISPSLGVNVGDPISGSFSLNFDDSVFSTNQNSVAIPFTDLNVSVGTNVLSFQTVFPFLEPNPQALFIRDGNYFVFDTIVADLAYSSGVNSNIDTRLTGGRLGGFNNSGEGLLFVSVPLTTGWTSSPQTGGFSSPGGVTQTCEGTGCMFRVNTPATSIPEPSSMLGILAFGALGIGSLKRKQKLATCAGSIK